MSTYAGTTQKQVKHKPSGRRCRVDARRAIHQCGVGAGLRVAMAEPRRVPPYMITLFLQRHLTQQNLHQKLLALTGARSAAKSALRARPISVRSDVGRQPFAAARPAQPLMSAWGCRPTVFATFVVNSCPRYSAAIKSFPRAHGPLGEWVPMHTGYTLVRVPTEDHRKQKKALYTAGPAPC